MSTFYHNAIPNTGGIYKITCVLTDKFYVGSAKNLRIRRKCHFRDLQKGIRTNPKLQHAWNKYGSESFTFEVLEFVLLPEILTAREQFWFDTLRPFGRRGFNISRVAGSCLGKECSPVTRAKIGAAHLGKPNPHPGYEVSPETRARMSKAKLGNPSNLGRKLTPEHRANISAGSPRRKHSPEDITKMSAANASRMKTLIVTSPECVAQVIHGIHKFCKEHYLDDTHLINVAKGRSKQHKGWKARYPETDAS